MSCICPLCGQDTPPLPLTLISERNMVVEGGRYVLLTGTEMAVLEAMADVAPNAIPKSRIMDLVYGGMDEPDLKIIDVFICRLRKKLAHLSVGIGTSWGVGYWLDVRPGDRADHGEVSS